MKKVFSALVAVGILPLAGQSLANVYGPAHVDVTEGLRFTPELEVGLGYDDNTAHTDQDKIDSWFYRITPDFRLNFGNNRTQFNTTYRLTDAHYFDSDEDDYTDHNFRVGVEHHFTRRHRFDTYYNYRRAHDARGEGILDTAGNQVDEVAEIDIHDVAFIYGFGAPSARINADFEVGYYDKEYANYRNVARFRDYETFRSRVTLYWRLGAKTQLLGEWNGNDTDYKHTAPGESDRESFDQQIYTGVRWEATSKTSGTVKLGYADRDFDSSDREDFDGVAWNVSVDWKPRTYSVFTFESGSRSKNPDTFGDYVEEDSYSLAWDHQWRERLSTAASIEYIDEEYTGVDRDDEFFAASVAISIAWKRWLKSDLGYQYSDQDSNLENAKYDKNQFLATIRVSL